MNINGLTSGTSVRLDVKSNKDKASLDTKVAMIHKNIVLLDPITSNGKIVGFSDDCHSSLTVTMGDNCYIWNNIKILPVSFKGSTFHAVELNGEAEVTNRRNNYRVSVGESMPITYFTDAGPRTHRPFIKDVSETGFAFISKETFDVGRTVRLNITLKDMTPLSMTAKIVRTCSTDREGDNLYGCQFGARNQKFSSWVMTLQRDKQKKKLGSHYLR